MIRDAKEYFANLAADAWGEIVVDASSSDAGLAFIDAVEARIEETDARAFYEGCMEEAAQMLRSGEFAEAEATFLAKANYFWNE